MRSPKMLFPAAFLAIALLVSGCGGKTEPTPSSGASTPSGTSSAGSSSGGSSSNDPSAPAGTSGTGSGNESPGAFIPGSEKGPAQNMPIPQLPVAAKQNNEAGAAAYVDYLFKLLTYTAVMRNSELLMEQVIAGKECKLCNLYQKRIDEMNSDNAWIQDRKYSTRVVRKFPPHPGKEHWEIQSRYTYPKTVVFEKNKKINAKLGDSANDIHAVGVQYVDGKWGITAWLLLAE